MQALILAAGSGSRLGSKTKERPKCLLEIGRRPLIDYQLEILAEAGISPVCMVVGYCDDEIREVVGIRAEYIENQRWSTTNSLYSFWLARDWVKDSLLVLNSDILFHPDILERVLSANGDAFAYDSSSGDAREHMKVRIRDNILVDMRKDLPLDRISGENVGILKFSKDTAQLLYQKAEELISKDSEKTWFPLAVNEIARDNEITGVEIAGLPWGEIESPFDLEKARKEILPKIEKNRSRKYFKKLKLLGVVSLVFLTFFLTYKIWNRPPPEQILWQTIYFTDIPSTEIFSDEDNQDWWILNKKDSLKLKIMGPNTLHIDTRAIIHGLSEGKSPYVLEIYLDGTRVNWFKHFKNESISWKNENNRITKLGRIELNILEGSHEVGIRLIAAESDACLIRLKKILSDDEE